MDRETLENLQKLNKTVDNLAVALTRSLVSINELKERVQALEEKIKSYGERLGN